MIVKESLGFFGSMGIVFGKDKTKRVKQQRLSTIKVNCCLVQSYLLDQ
jgi:hypothetical protein